MWFSVVLLAKWSFRGLALGTWIVVLLGGLVGWLYRWIMDDSR